MYEEYVSLVSNTYQQYFFNSSEKDVWFLLFHANTSGAKPRSKITNSYPLGDLTAVHVDLYFLVKAECFSEQEVPVEEKAS